MRFISLCKIIFSNVTVAVISFLSEQFFKYLVAPRGRVGTKKLEDIPCIIVFLFDSSLTSSLSIPLKGRLVPITDSFTCLIGATKYLKNCSLKKEITATVTLLRIILQSYIKRAPFPLFSNHYMIGMWQERSKA